MDNRIIIGDFVKLTGSTLKTVLYYHKIGLIPEPARSAGGYRLYGSAELIRMQTIKHLKSLGFDLKRIKEILGDIHKHKTLREVLQSLQTELLNEQKSLEERIKKIEILLHEKTVLLEEDSFTSPSFQMIMDILGPEQIEKYAQTCPQLFEQQRKIYSILDDFHWGDDYQENLGALAEFFKAHPQEYQSTLEYGARLARVAQLSENDPEVVSLARESAQFIKSRPQLAEVLSKQSGIKNPLASLYNDMVGNVLSPSQLKFGQLLRQFLSSETDNTGDFE